MQEADRHNVTDVFVSLRSKLKAVATRLLRNEDDAEDALQEAFCRIWTRRDRIDDRAGALSMTVVRNVCIDMLRRDAAHRSLSLDDEGASRLHDVVDDVAESRPMGQLYASIALALSPQQCEMLLHRDRDGWSIEELAETYGLSQANVRTILSRARKAVREQYRKSQNPQI